MYLLFEGNGHSLKFSLPRGGKPPNHVGGITALGGTAANWAAFPPAREGKNNRLDARYLPLAYSKQRADRGGCHQPRPAQRDSDAALLNPDRGRGALRPPQALWSGGGQGVRALALPPSGRPGNLCQGADGPPHFKVPGSVEGGFPHNHNGAGFHPGLAPLPTTEGSTVETWATPPWPLPTYPPPRGSTCYPGATPPVS